MSAGAIPNLGPERSQIYARSDPKFMPEATPRPPYNPWSFLLATRCCSIKAFLEKNKKSLRVWAQVSMVEQTMHHFPLPHAGIDWHTEDHTMCCVLILCPNRYAFPSPAFSSGNFSSAYTKSSLNLWSAKI